jgi:hypothetical protein
MAYVDTYQVNVLNRLANRVVVTFSKKDGDAESVTTFKCTKLNLAYKAAEGKFTPIFGASLEVELFVGQNDEDPWVEFAQAEKDTWKVVATYDNNPLFYGYVVPEESAIPLRAKPYTVKVTASDGLGLIKTEDLIKPDGSAFNTHHSIISYLAAALQQTGLELPIRVYDNVYHASFSNRDDDYKWDFFGQACLEYRTFLKDPVTFVDAYSAIELILKENYRLFQWNGQWTIIRLGMLQYTPFVGYYTIYDKDGLNPVGYEYLDNYGTFGRNQLTYAINKEQRKTIKQATKDCKITFKYNVWPELPKNVKLERGELISDEGTVKTYQIDDMTFGKFNGTPTALNLLPDLQAASTSAYRKSTFNDYGDEISREIIMEEPRLSDGAFRNILMTEGIPVIAGDKIKVSFDFKSSLSSSTGSVSVCTVMLISADGNSMIYVDNQGTDGSGPFKWQQDTTLGLVNYQYVNNLNEYAGFQIEPDEIPFSGTLYVGLCTQGFVGHQAYFKNLNVDYKPYVAGGYLQVKGDYWRVTQEINYPGKSEEEVYVSDNIHKVFKGTLLDLSGNPLTSDFYRLGLSESLHYKQITAMNRFNMIHRRMLHIEGSFKGITFAPQNNINGQMPIGLHKQYRYTFAETDQRFILSAPLDIDLRNGWINARFEEIYAESKNDGTTSGTHLYKFLF